MSRASSIPAARESRQGGMALVITLAVLVLMTVAVMAFFLRTTANRSIEVARSNQVLASEVAASAEDYTLAALKNEISSKSATNTANGSTFYRPTNSIFAAPQRVPDAAAFPPATFPSLIRRSVNETANGIGEANASAHSTATPSRDGSAVTADRWNATRLNIGPGFVAGQVPHWIYLNRDGFVAATPSTNAVGRFAYAVYDIAGLLDVNHAGGGPDVGRFKGWLHNADVATAAGATIDPAALLQWRSGNLTGSELREERNRTGGLRPTIPDGRQFSSRRDLLRALGNNAAAAATGLTGGVDLAPYLTHFTRELHAPSLPFLDAQATLGFPAGEKDRFAAFYAAKQTFTGYRDDGTTYTYELKSGAPVLHRRFSLGKLGRESGGTYQYWLTPTGPGEGISEAAIKAVFGLRWNSGQERWDYTSPDGNATTDEIKTLAQVAAANRPPDFFEILKAGLNPDSLGGCQTESGATQLTLEEQARQGSTDLHVLRIGASMIDQADNDNYPTRLGFSLAGADIEAAGVEDLPYLFGIALRTQYGLPNIPGRFGRTKLDTNQVTAAGGDPTTQDGYFWDRVRVIMSPVLFNPHRSGPAATNTPALSFELLGGEVSDLGDDNLSPAPFLKVVNYANGTSLSNASLLIPAAALSAFDSYRACPKNINNDYRTVVGNNTNVPNHLPAFTLPFSDTTPPAGLSVTNPLLVPKNNTRELVGDLRFKFAGLRVGLSYASPGGQKRIYDTLGGAVTPGWDGIDTGWLSAGFALDYLLENTNFSSPDNLGNTIGALVKLDPRTPRFGAFVSLNRVNNNIRLQKISEDKYLNGADSGSPGAAEWPLGPLDAAFTLTNPQTAGLNVNLGTGSIFVANRFFTGGTNASSGTSILNIPDRPQDGAGAVIRPNDGFFSDATGSANALQSEDGAYPYRAAPNDSPKRPVILQRPFRNVAELGHVYRDQPWKSLNFFHQSSPDLALLDLFSIGEVEPVQVAGMVGANSASEASLKSLLRNAGQTLANNAAIYSNTPTPAQADNVATNLATLFANNRQLTPGALLTNVGTLSGLITANLGTIKAERETLARALAGSGQVRTWNVMIDLIAQTGRFPAGPTGAGDFVVGGERRLWIHAAIDRFTGEITDLERESIPE